MRTGLQWMIESDWAAAAQAWISVDVRQAKFFYDWI